MSYSLLALHADRPITVADAHNVYSDLLAGQRVDLGTEGVSGIQSMVALLSRRWPTLKTLDSNGNTLDDSPWAEDLDISDHHLLAEVKWPSAKEVSTVFRDLGTNCGLYVYDPQEEELYPPLPPEGRRASDLNPGGMGPPETDSLLRAQGGRSLAVEMLTDILQSTIGVTLKEAANDRLDFKFDTGNDVTVILGMFVSTGGVSRTFTAQADVWVFHRSIQSAYLALNPPITQDWTMHREVRGARRRWRLDADSPDLNTIGDLTEAVTQCLTWAESLENPLALAEAARNSEETPQYLAPVVLGELGYGDEAIVATERVALRIAYRGGNGDYKPYVAKLNAAYDSQYRALTDSLIASAPIAVREKIEILPDLFSLIPDIHDAETTSAWLLESLHDLDYVPVRRDILALLGLPWTRPNALVADVLLDQFANVVGSHTLSMAAAESFKEKADDSALDKACALIEDQRYGTFRAPLVSALAKMGPRERVIPVLVKLLGDSEMVLWALNAIATARMVETLPAIDDLLRSAAGRVRDAAAQTRKRLVILPKSVQ